MTTYDSSKYAAVGIGNRIEQDDYIQWGESYTHVAGKVEPVASLMGFVDSLVTEDDDFTILRPIAVEPQQSGEASAPYSIDDLPAGDWASKWSVQPALNCHGVAHNPTPPATERKGVPVYTGFLAYFPDAIRAVAELSRIGNDQHNPGKPLHWDRSKSGDELDALGRHLLDTVDEVKDTDDVLHATKVAWRAMANLQKVLEAQK